MKQKIILVIFIAFEISASAQKCAIKYDTVSKREYYVLANKMPSYKGGPEMLEKTISKHLKWPGGRCCIDGSVFVSFVVELDGRLTNRRVVKGISNAPVCNADGEALKVLDFLDGWIPGKCNEKKVPIQLIIPIKFTLDSPP